MAAPKAQWGALNWTLNLEKLVSAWKHVINEHRRTGRLHDALKLISVKGTAKERLELTVRAVPYARILDLGGTIPARPTAANMRGQTMKFVGSRDGATVYAKRVAGFEYPARHWVERGFDQFWRAGTYRGERPLAVGWPDGAA